MSNNQLAGFPAFGARVDTRITYHPVEYVPDPALVLPSSEPGTAQVQFTVNEASLPTWDPVYPNLATDDFTFDTKYVVCTIVGFYNAGASSYTINGKYKSAKPSTFTATAAGSIGAGKYKMITIMDTMSSLALNDVHEMKFYTNDTGGDANVKLLWAYMVVIPYYLVRTITTPVQSRVADLAIDMSNASWVGAASIQVPTTNYASYRVVTRNADGSATAFEVAASVVFPAYSSPTSTAYMARRPTTDPSPWSNDQTTDNKRHKQPYYPTRIAYTPIL